MARQFRGRDQGGRRIRTMTAWLALTLRRDNTPYGIDMNLRTTFLTILASAFALSACAGDSGRYPSLALRDVERRSFVVADAPPAPAVPVVVAETSRIAALRASAESAHETFTRKQPGAAALVARARRQGPDSAGRAAALVALADLAAARSATFVPLSELDRINAEIAADYGETAPVVAAQAAVLALIEQQDASLDALWGELGQ